MTEIEFHVNVPDKLHYSCRLLRKAYRSGVKAIITAEPELLNQLDQLLWSFSPTEFLPHCAHHASAIANTLVSTPILLCGEVQNVPLHTVLINLGQQLPANFERFQRFIEIASDTNEDIVAARIRWKHYRDRGYSLKRHDQPAGQAA